MKVLLVVHDSSAVAAVADALRSRGHTVDRVPSTRDFAAAPSCDVVLVELDERDGGSAEQCRELRARTDIAIVCLVRRGRERTGLVALREGADDFLTVPVNVAELLARIDAVFRRARPKPSGEQTIGHLSIDVDRRQACVRGERVALTRKEFQLLTALSRTPGVVITKDRLMAEVWNTSVRGRSRTLDSHINNLRGKIGSAATVENVRGVGYRIMEVAPE